MILGALPAAGSASGGVHHVEMLLFFVLMQLILILAAARIVGQAARWIGQPRVVGEILAGLILGPSLFGHFFPATFDYVFKSTPPEPLSILSQIGLIFLMFQIGLDFDFSHLSTSRNRRAVILVSASGIALPFSLGLWLGHVSHAPLAATIHETGYVLFMATAMSITAIPILGRIMMELDLTRTKLGAIAISAAAFDDVVGWVLLALISSVATAQFSAASTAKQILWLLVYFTLCWWGVRPLLRRLVNRFHAGPSRLPANLLATLLVVILASAITTYRLGIFAIFGGFMMGVLLYDRTEFVQAWKGKVADFVSVFFLPIFFTFTGLRTNVQGLDSPSLWLWCLAVIGVATLGKYGGCTLAARVAGLNPLESHCLGIMMNTRALMELVVLNVGYDLGLLPRDVFTMLVLMALFSTVVTTPLLRLWLPKLGHQLPLVPPET
ncbi:MAG TPA: cation:proton antiporter [Candidatus Polarisedimenticolia bacterium]|nr:cation:proton antiporter [Candidatus Polarisedimenticolia bacterium]